MVAEINVNAYKSSRPDVLYKIVVLKHFTKLTEKHLCQSLFFNADNAFNFIKKETLSQVFSSEFCEIFKSTFFFQNTSSGCICDCPFLAFSDLTCHLVDTGKRCFLVALCHLNVSRLKLGVETSRLLHQQVKIPD